MTNYSELTNERLNMEVARHLGGEFEAYNGVSIPTSYGTVSYFDWAGNGDQALDLVGDGYLISGLVFDKSACFAMLQNDNGKFEGRDPHTRVRAIVIAWLVWQDAKAGKYA